MRGNKSPLEFSEVTVGTTRFFRRLHCDIVANTINADLLDYIRRDTRVAGLPRDLDRRFYTYISSAAYRGKQRVVVELQDRQGHVRRDALSDLMNCMEIRYIIHRANRLASSRQSPLGQWQHGSTLQWYPSPAKVWPVVERMYGDWGKWRSDAELLGGANPT